MPFISPTRLFNAGMVAQCPALGTLMSFARGKESHGRLDRERILARLLEQLPYLPTCQKRRPLEGLRFDSFDDVRALASVQMARSHLEKTLHARWCQVWKGIDDARLRRFAQTCATLLTELFHIADVAKSASA